MTSTFTSLGVIATGAAPAPCRNRAAPARIQMKFVGGFESGPLAPKTASWIFCPGFTSRPITSRFGAFQPAIDRAAALAQGARQFAVHPDLGVVVDGSRRRPSSPAWRSRRSAPES